MKKNHLFRARIVLFATSLLFFSLTSPVFAQSNVVPDKETIESVLNEETKTVLDIVANETSELDSPTMPEDVIAPPALEIVPSDAAKPELETATDKALDQSNEGLLPSRRVISIETNLGTVIKEGEIITMTAMLEGFDGTDVALQWQRRDGGEWEDIQEAIGMEYQYLANESTLRCEWRVKIRILSATDSR